MTLYHNNFVIYFRPRLMVIQQVRFFNHGNYALFYGVGQALVPQMVQPLPLVMVRVQVKILVQPLVQVQVMDLIQVLAQAKVQILRAQAQVSIPEQLIMS